MNQIIEGLGHYNNNYHHTELPISVRGITSIQFSPGEQRLTLCVAPTSSLGFWETSLLTAPHQPSPMLEERHKESSPWTRPALLFGVGKGSKGTDGS